MLQLLKNQLITSVAQRHVELRQHELDWYTNNFWTLSQQSALLAGFAFGQLTTELPADIPFHVECPYLFSTALCLGIHLCVLVSTTFCCVWGPGLALRGPHGTRSVHLAVDNLQSEQNFIFGLFVCGLIAFLFSNIFLTWAYYVEWIAVLASSIMGAFGVAILLFVFTTTAQLRVGDADAITGRIFALHKYETIADLDQIVTHTGPPSPQHRPGLTLHYDGE